ncbi:MAG: TetR/AcrR family transcriptional regulator [Thermoleophilaceae bacterium]
MSITPRKRLSGQERRAAILDSALSVFADRGYHASSIDDIAREAGISKALIYEHFSSKQELYAELIQHHADELFERIAAAIERAGRAGAARLTVGVGAFYEFVEDHRVAWRMLFREVTDADVAAVLDRILAQVTALVAALIAEDPGARAQGDDETTREQAIQMLAQMVVGSVQSLANWWADHQEIPRERIVEITMDYAWLGLDRLSRGERWRPPGR